MSPSDGDENWRPHCLSAIDEIHPPAVVLGKFSSQDRPAPELRGFVTFGYLTGWSRGEEARAQKGQEALFLFYLLSNIAHGHKMGTIGEIPK